MFMCQYLRTHGPFQEDAGVVRVLDKSFDVVVLRFALEVRIYVDKLGVQADFNKDKG